MISQIITFLYKYQICNNSSPLYHLLHFTPGSLTNPTSNLMDVQFIVQCISKKYLIKLRLEIVSVCRIFTLGRHKVATGMSSPSLALGQKSFHNLVGESNPRPLRLLFIYVSFIKSAKMTSDLFFYPFP